MNKSELRGHFVRLRESLSPQEVTAASAALCQRLAAWVVLCETQTALTYLAFRNELDLSGLFDLLPHIHWVAPRIAKGRRLILHSYDPAHLVRHPFGMLEPAADLPVVDPITLEIVLTPGAAFDRRGARLGFGGGYYDRFLLTTPALRVGITYDNCLADEGQIPCAEHDQRMDWVVTPTQEIRCKVDLRIN